MAGVLKEKILIHSSVIWAIILIWFLLFVDRFMPDTRISVEQFITSQSFWLLSEPPEEASNITIVAIDEVSRRRLNLKWPWKRGITADLVANITSQSPKVVGLDIIFSGKSEEREDRKLAEAIASRPGVILGYILNQDSSEKPLNEFVAAAASTGFVNKPFKMGVLNRTRTYHVNGNGEVELSLDIEILRNYLEIDRSAVKVTREGISLGNSLFIPSPGGITPLNYLVHPLRFRIIPAYFVLENKVDSSYFKDKIVLVGATDPIIHDEFITPIGISPGVTIIGNSLSMFLSQRFIRTIPAWIEYALIFSFGLFLLLVGSSKVRLLYSFILFTITMTLAYASFIYLRSVDLKLPYLAILFSASSAYLIPNLYRYLNLLYLSGRLRNLALQDPLTGFYTPRFFLLRLNERLTSGGEFCFAALRIKNYNRLTLELSFEEIKSLTKTMSMRLRSELAPRLRRAEYARLSGNTFVVISEGADMRQFGDSLSTFIENIKGDGMMLGDKKVIVSLQGCLLYRLGGEVVTAKGMISQMEEIFRKMKGEDLLIEDLRSTSEDPKRDISMDMFDFITYDWEERNKDLENHLREILEANKKLDRLNWGALRALARTVDAKSSWTAGHSERVTGLALKTGRGMGMSQEDLDNPHRAGLLHDIGKIGVPQEILDKPGKFTEEEYRVMREHPVKGASILEPIEDYAEIIPLIRQHHEWFNGGGYPDGLKGEEITLGARILAVADVFDALISDRPYRAGLSLERVTSIMKEGVGTQFDPGVVDAFLTVIEQSPELSLQTEASETAMK